MTPTKEKALAALLTSKTKEEAAKRAGITSRTLRKYFDDPEFVRAYKKAFASLLEDATRQAQQVLRPALNTLLEIIENKDENTGARVSASRTAIESALRLTEANDIVAELRELGGGDL